VDEQGYKHHHLPMTQINYTLSDGGEATQSKIVFHPVFITILELSRLFHLFQNKD
jgi:hypothetical protein